MGEFPSKELNESNDYFLEIVAIIEDIIFLWVC